MRLGWHFPFFFFQRQPAFLQLRFAGKCLQISLAEPKHASRPGGPAGVFVVVVAGVFVVVVAGVFVVVVVGLSVGLALGGSGVGAGVGSGVGSVGAGVGGQVSPSSRPQQPVVPHGATRSELSVSATVPWATHVLTSQRALGNVPVISL